MASPSRAGCSTSAIRRDGHEPAGPDRRPATGHLGDLDDAAGGRHLDPPAGAAGHDIECLDGAAGIDDDLDPIALHATARSFIGSAGAAIALGDDLGEDRQRGLGRVAPAEIESDRAAQPRHLLRA